MPTSSVLSLQSVGEQPTLKELNKQWRARRSVPEAVMRNRWEWIDTPGLDPELNAFLKR